jgi:hypothetical protein
MILVVLIGKAYPWFATLPNTTQQLEHTVHAPDYLDYLGRGKDWTGAYADNVKQLNLRLRRLVHQAMADIIDPSRCAHTAPGFPNAVCVLTTEGVTSIGCIRPRCCYPQSPGRYRLRRWRTEASPGSTRLAWLPRRCWATRTATLRDGLFSRAAACIPFFPVSPSAACYCAFVITGPAVFARCG